MFQPLNSCSKTIQTIKTKEIPQPFTWICSPFLSIKRRRGKKIIQRCHWWELCDPQSLIYWVAGWFKVRTRSFTFRTGSHRSGTYAKTLSCPCLSLHTSCILRLWPQGEMQLPLGINKCSKNTSLEGICKQFYLLATLGTFTVTRL